MKKDRLSFIVIGGGYIGRRHAASLQRNSQCDLTAIIEKDLAIYPLLEAFGVPLFSSLDAYKAAGLKADAAIIATPNGTHATLATEALGMGMHVMIEKPMALTRQDALRIISKGKEVNRKVMVVLQNRFSPASQWLKETVEHGVLGKIFLVEVNCYWNRDERYYTKDSWHGTAAMDGGSLYTQFSHFIDTLYWLFGDVKNIQSRFFNFNHQQHTEFEDSGLIAFDFVKEGSGCFNFSTSCYEENMESSMTILAEKGSIKVSGQYMNAIEHCRIKDLPGTPKLELVDAHHNNDRMLDAMVKAVLEDGSTNAEDAAKAVEMIGRMYGVGRG